MNKLVNKCTSRNKYGLLFILFCVSFLSVFSSLVSAESLATPQLIAVNSQLTNALSTDPQSTLVIVVDSPDLSSSIEGISVSQFNDFENPILFEDNLPNSKTIEIILEDSLGNLIAKSYLGGYSTLFDFSPEITKIKIISSTKVLVEKSVSFCNHNNICEPCEGANCTIIENTLTCGDCSSGAKDYFCNTVEDGVCDPDCDSDLYEPDCLDQQEFDAISTEDIAEGNPANEEIGEFAGEESGKEIKNKKVVETEPVFLSEQNKEKLASFTEQNSVVLTIAAIFIVLLLLFLIIYSFYHKSKREIPLSSDQNKQYPESASPPVSYFNLQSQINYFASRRYSYSQIRSILLKKGYSLENVSAEINRHYQNSINSKRK